ncbi:MAG TPA: extracellular solute-binding protein [Solirubrobacteraceae bacterium]
MLHSRLLRRWWAVLALAVAIVGATGVLLASAGGADNALVVYNGRSHYGGEEAFAAFTRETGIKVKLFGGEAETLHQRLKSEGARTPADVLVTVDGANLARAKQEGLLRPVRSAAIDRAVPAGLRDPDGTWTALSTRVRTPMVSTERVGAGAVRSYEDLGDARWKGRLCLRTSNNIYNQSLVADFIAKRGAARTERLLRSWMANDPTILGSDVDVLKAIAADRCDAGLTNHYYLARMLKDDPEFPVAPAWPDQGAGRPGAHANLSGAGVVAASDRPEQAQKLVEFLVEREAQEAIAANGEFPANPRVPPAAHIRRWAGIRTEPIDVPGAAAHAQDAVALMAKVGWR